MTSRYRREPLPRQPSLRASARAKGTAKGFAASKGVRIPYAEPTGRTATWTTMKPNPASTCTAERWCDEPRLSGYLWCSRHVNRARTLNAVVPLDL